MFGSDLRKERTRPCVDRSPVSQQTVKNEERQSTQRRTAGPKLPTRLTTKNPLMKKQHVRQEAPLLLFHLLLLTPLCHRAQAAMTVPALRLRLPLLRAPAAALSLHSSATNTSSFCLFVPRLCLPAERLLCSVLKQLNEDMLLKGSSFACSPV